MLVWFGLFSCSWACSFSFSFFCYCFFAGGEFFIISASTGNNAFRTLLSVNYTACPQWQEDAEVCLRFWIKEKKREGRKQERQQQPFCLFLSRVPNVNVSWRGCKKEKAVVWKDTSCHSTIKKPPQKIPHKHASHRLYKTTVNVSII